MYLLSAQWHCFLIWHSMQPHPNPPCWIWFLYIYNSVFCYQKLWYLFGYNSWRLLRFFIYLSVSVLSLFCDYFFMYHTCFRRLAALSNLRAYSRCSSHSLPLSLSSCSAPREREEGALCPCAGEHLNKCFVFVQNSLLLFFLTYY